MRTLLSALAALASACAADAGSGDSSGVVDLDAHRMQWNRPGRDAYSFVWQQSCFCPSEVTRAIRVTVDFDRIVSATYVDDGQPVSAYARSTLLTINGVFDLIQRGFEASYDVVRVQYAPTGYPQQVMLDVSTQGADDERQIELRDVATTAE